MSTLPLGDIELYYERRGSGPRLLMFNGSGSSIEAAVILVDRLAEHFEVLVHDQRGLGRTTVPDRPATMADYASDALALLDHVGWPTARVFGISFGGMVAQELAVGSPQRVESLALLCTSAGGEGGSSYPLHKMVHMPPEERSLVSLRNLDTRFDLAWLHDHPVDQAIVATMIDRADAPRTGEQRRGEALQLEARRGHDVWNRLGLIRCPTLIACGRYDGLAPPLNSKAIHSRIAGSQLRCYEGGHLFIYQDGRALPEIIEFLADEPPRRPAGP